MGLNLRSLNRREKSLALAALLIIFSVFVLLSSLCGLAILYLLKSALGIDLLEGFSLGLWGCYNGT
jgi:LytS/YehU family sensor histidine kinase